MNKLNLEGVCAKPLYVVIINPNIYDLLIAEII